MAARAADVDPWRPSPPIETCVFEPGVRFDEATGHERAEFSWTVSSADVGEHCVVHFYMSEDGTESHRANGFDQRGYFDYVVRPPLGH
jgi:hypothetical protein